MNASRAATTFAASAFLVAVTAASPVGVWKGKIFANVSTPANASPNLKASMEKIKRQIAAATATLTLKADRSFVLTIVGLPSPTTVGTWSQRGNAVTLTSRKKASKPQSLTIDAIGRTMTLIEPRNGGKVVFTR